MQRNLAVVLLLMIVFAGVGSSALAERSSTHSRQSAAVRDERRLGPKPLPFWYWRWVEWRLGEGYAKGHELQPSLRPAGAPPRIQRWAWRRLRFFLIARGPTRTGSGPASTGGESYQTAISYTQKRPSFTPTRTVGVSSASQLQAAISKLRPGDLVQGDVELHGFQLVCRSAGDSESPLGPRRDRLDRRQDRLHGIPAVPRRLVEQRLQPLHLRGRLRPRHTGGVCLVVYGSQHVPGGGSPPTTAAVSASGARRSAAPSTTTTSKARSGRSARTSPGTPTPRKAPACTAPTSGTPPRPATSPTTASPSTSTTSPPAPASSSATTNPPPRPPATSST